MDLGITRGDGFFETISVVDGHPQALEPHLARLKHSAELMDMPEPDTDVWRVAVLAGIGAHQLEHGVRARALRETDHDPGRRRNRHAHRLGLRGHRVKTSRPRARASAS